jgi:hypothetical protein
VIMAQIGCYVPAAFMALSPYESLHTRVGTADSIESNASSFMVEMADVAHLMDRCSVTTCNHCDTFQWGCGRGESWRLVVKTSHKCMIVAAWQR